MTDNNKCTELKAGKLVNLFAEYKLYVSHEKMRFDSTAYQGGMYGNQAPANDPEYAFDYRYFKKSPLKHSAYFRRMRNLQETAQFYTGVGFLPERYCEEYPLPFGNVELQCDAQLEFGDGFKCISLDTGQVIFIYENQGVHIFNLKDELPELYLSFESFLQVDDTPLYDLFVSKGIVPENSEKTYRMCSYSDTLSINGGTFSLNYEVSFKGALQEINTLEIRLFKRTSMEQDKEISHDVPCSD